MNRLLKKRNSLQRKIVAFHDYDSRSYAGIYIDGEFYEDDSHSEALEQYLQNNDIKRRYSKDPDVCVDRDQLMKELNSDDINTLPFGCINIINTINYDYLIENYIYDNSLEKNDYEKELSMSKGTDAIFIEQDTLNNISLQELISKIKSKYPKHDIYIDNFNNDPFKFEQYERVAKLKKLSNAEYTWNEICNIINNAGGTIYSSPFGSYDNDTFKIETIEIDKIPRSNYLTIDDCKELDLDEDENVIMNLVYAYEDGDDIPPIILDNDYHIIDGSHRLGMYDYLNIKYIKSFILQK